MSNIIAGDPAPTNPQAESAIRSLLNGGYGERQAREIIASVQGEARESGYRQGRSQALGEAQARLDETFRLAPVPGTSDGINYAIGILMSLRGESRG